MIFEAPVTNVLEQDHGVNIDPNFIYIKTPTSEIITLSDTLHDSIQDIESNISTRKSFPLNSNDYCMMEKPLLDQYTLNKYKLTNPASLCVIWFQTEF